MPRSCPVTDQRPGRRRSMGAIDGPAGRVAAATGRRPRAVRGRRKPTPIGQHIAACHGSEDASGPDRARRERTLRRERATHRLHWRGAGLLAGNCSCVGADLRSAPDRIKATKASDPGRPSRVGRASPMAPIMVCAIQLDTHGRVQLALRIRADNSPMRSARGVPRNTSAASSCARRCVQRSLRGIPRPTVSATGP
jgi:hypothetical protein